MKKNKTALIYFSNTGNTKKIAGEIIKRFSPEEIIEIKLKKPYGNFISSVGRYIKNNIIKKEDQVITNPVNLSSYETIFLGSPVWAGHLPGFVSQFLKECKIGNSKIIPFITAAKTGKDSTLEEIKLIYPNSEISDYFFQSKFEKEEPEEWFNNLNV